MDDLTIRAIEANHLLLARIESSVERSAKNPIRVVFMLPEISLWDVYAPIYRRMSQTPHFAPFVLAFDRVDVQADKTGAEVSEFLRTSGIAGTFAGGDARSLPHVASLEPDIVFYTLGSGAYPEPYKLEFVSRYVRTCYVSYGFLMVNALNYQFGFPFHQAAWTVFASTRREMDEYEARCRRLKPNSVLTGYPKFDLYRGGDEPPSEPKTVVWAPHWTIGLVYPQLNFGMFPEVFWGMMELMERMKELRFIFRPHPNLKYACAKSGYMQFEHYDFYLGKMAEMANVEVYAAGNNIDHFRSSVGMITDSISFLAEYLPSGRPLLFLNRPDRSRMTDAGEEIASAHYWGRSIADIEEFLVKRVIGGEDPRRDERREVAARVLNIGDTPATEAIISHLESAFRIRSRFSQRILGRFGGGSSAPRGA